jgi:hypothetical protein
MVDKWNIGIIDFFVISTHNPITPLFQYSAISLEKITIPSSPLKEESGIREKLDAGRFASDL